MQNYNNTAQFYKSEDWANCKATVLHSRLKDGAIYCEYCHKLILKDFNPSANNNAGAIVYHHTIPLNNFNVNDASISINPAKIQIVHWACHNIIHNRFTAGTNGQPEKKVYLITGPSCSGKSTYVKERLEPGDIVLDVDDIWEQVSGQPRYTKPNALKPIVFKIRDTIKDLISKGAGTWRNAFIIESLPSKADREREAERYRAYNVEVITMQASAQECIERLHKAPGGRDIKNYEGYIQDYFKRLT